MKKMTLCLGFIAILLVISLAAGSPAQASTVTFDDAYANSIQDVTFYNSQSFSDAGLTFTNHGWYMAVWDPSTPNSNGTDSLIFAGFSTGDYLAITKTGGGAFGVTSVDMSISWYDGNSSEIISINGSPTTLIQGIQTYTLNLNGITELDITGVPSNSGYWLLDNVNYNSVPEPCTMLLLGSGLVALAAFRKKSRA